MKSTIPTQSKIIPVFVCAGERRTVVSCMRIANKTMEVVNNSYCKPENRPHPQIRLCNTHPCQYRWDTHTNIHRHTQSCWLLVNFYELFFRHAITEVSFHCYCYCKCKSFDHSEWCAAACAVTGITESRRGRSRGSAGWHSADQLALPMIFNTVCCLAAKWRIQPLSPITLFKCWCFQL